ncbi:MAG: hypothetical protein WBA16_03220 [Nonlabens sp.]
MKLRHNDLVHTINALHPVRDQDLVQDLQRILRENKVLKPRLHHNFNSLNNNWYHISLPVETVTAIITILGDREVALLDENYESTVKSKDVSEHLDRWSSGF